MTTLLIITTIFFALTTIFFTNKAVSEYRYGRVLSDHLKDEFDNHTDTMLREMETLNDLGELGILKYNKEYLEGVISERLSLSDIDVKFDSK